MRAGLPGLTALTIESFGEEDRDDLSSMVRCANGRQGDCLANLRELAQAEYVLMWSLVRLREGHVTLNGYLVDLADGSTVSRLTEQAKSIEELEGSAAKFASDLLAGGRRSVTKYRFPDVPKYTRWQVAVLPSFSGGGE